MLQRHLDSITRYLTSRFDLTGPVEPSLYGVLHGTDSGGIISTWAYFRVLDENFEPSHMGAVSAETHPMRDGVTIQIWASPDVQRPE